MNPVGPSTSPFPPSFFSPSSSSSLVDSSPPTSWNSVPRPRLKRAHSSTTPPAPPNNSPQGPLSPALQPASLFTPLGTSSSSTNTPSHSRNGSLGVIQELPQAETLATSPPLSAPIPPHPPRDTLPPRSKRRRIAPDSDAFSRLSLNYSPIPSNSTSTPFYSPPATSHPPSSFFPSSPTILPSSYPSVPPTSPDFLPSHPFNHQLPTSISPPNFSPLHASSSPPVPPPHTLFPPLTSSQPFINSTPSTYLDEKQPQEGQVEEIEMNHTSNGGGGQSSWDLDPHRIYVASLSDDDDSDIDDEKKKKRREKEAEEEEAEEKFRLNKLVASGLPSSPLGGLLLSNDRSKRKDGSGTLILYQPPPTLHLNGSGGGVGARKNETRVERIRREEIERKKEEDWAEFKRESEMVEARSDLDQIAGGGGEGTQGDGMDVEEEMQMEF